MEISGRDMMFNRFKEVCQKNGFVRRKKAFFRVVGDGVFQVLKFGWRRYAFNPTFDLGLFSTYGVIRESMVTASGFGQYEVYTTGADFVETVASISQEFPFNKHMEILEKIAIPWMNSINTQGKLAEALCILDCVRLSDLTVESFTSGTVKVFDSALDSRIMWNDSYKLAPFVHCGEIEKAQRIAKGIRDQHADALQSRYKYMSPEEIEAYIEETNKFHERLYSFLQMIDTNDVENLSKCIYENYENNKKLVGFAMGKTKD